MLQVIIILVCSYIVFSVILGISRLNTYARFEDSMDDVPIGDSCYYKPPVLVDGLTYVFFPSVLVIKGWILIVRKFFN